MTEERDYRFPDHPGKDPAEEWSGILDCFPICAVYWASNEQFGSGDFIRPTRATGFAYECTTAGTAGAREPVWPRVVAATVTDGSVTWTCRAASTNGINAITSPSVVSDPTGLTVDVDVEEGTKLIPTYSGGTVGQDYDAVFSFTLNGLLRVARQRVPIRKR
jgi:hypothetical protein